MAAQGLGTREGGGGEQKNTKLDKYVQAPLWQFSCHYFLAVFHHNIQSTHFQGFYFSVIFSFLLDKHNWGKTCSQKTSNKTSPEALRHLEFFQERWPFPGRLCFANKTALRATSSTPVWPFYVASTVWRHSAPLYLVLTAVLHCGKKTVLPVILLAKHHLAKEERSSCSKCVSTAVFIWQDLQNWVLTEGIWKRVTYHFYITSDGSERRQIPRMWEHAWG